MAPTYKMPDADTNTTPQTPAPPQVTVVAPTPAAVVQNMGLTGIFATVANMTAVVVITGLLVWLLTSYTPQEHERANEQRQKDRERFDELLQKFRDREDARMEKLWSRQAELKTAINDLIVELKSTRASVRKAGDDARGADK